LEISTADRPGLLAQLGSILSRYHITVQGAKIQTLGERVEDIFFLCDTAGGPISDNTLLSRIESELFEEMSGKKNREPADREITI